MACSYYTFLSLTLHSQSVMGGSLHRPGSHAHIPSPLPPHPTSLHSPRPTARSPLPIPQITRAAWASATRHSTELSAIRSALSHPPAGQRPPPTALSTLPPPCRPAPTHTEATCHTPGVCHARDQCSVHRQLFWHCPEGDPSIHLKKETSAWIERNNDDACMYLWMTLSPCHYYHQNC